MCVPCALTAPRAWPPLGTLHTSHRTSPAYHTDTSGSGVREWSRGCTLRLGRALGGARAHLGSAQQKPAQTGKAEVDQRPTGSLGDRATPVTRVPGLGASVTARHPASPAALEAGGKVAPTSQAFSTKSPLVLVFPQSLVTGDNFTQNAKGRKEAKAGTSRNAGGPLGAPRAVPWHPPTPHGSPHGSPLARTHAPPISAQGKGPGPASLPSVPRTQPDAWEAQCTFLLCFENSPGHSRMC